MYSILNKRGTAMKKFNLTDLLIFIVSTELVGAVSALIAGNFGILYIELLKPPFSPPSFIFPIVWAILYAIMGYSAHLIFSEEYKIDNKNTALGFYVIQLTLNFLWSILFFRFKLYLISIIVAVLLFATIWAMILSFRKVKPFAALINIPYLIWTAFSIYLTIGICNLNTIP